VLVTDGRGGFCLASKSVGGLLVVREFAAQDLQGDLFIENRVPTQVHESHRTFTEHSFDEIASVEYLPDAYASA
jgi:hypothetical protein